MRGGRGGVPLRLHTQTLNYMLVCEHMGGSVRINTHWQTQRQLWVGHWGLIEDLARAPALIKFTVLVLVRFSRENKHSPLGLSPGGWGVAEDVEAWGPAGTDSSCGMVWCVCGGGG